VKGTHGFKADNQVEIDNTCSWLKENGHTLINREY
jgi:hypothetical protein